MTTPTPRTDAAIIRDKMILSEVGPLEIVDAGTSRQLERDLAAAQDNRQYTCEAHRDEVKKGGRCVWCDLNVAHEELNTQAHELERLLNELSAAQERIREFEEASAGLTRNQVGLLNSLAHANERAQAAEARAEKNARDAERYRWLRDVHAYHYTVTRYIGGATIPRLNGASLDAAIDAAIAARDKP